jgi:hypothetical protein
MAGERKTFMIEGAQIIFRNFEGKESQYNREGDRNFAVILDPAVAKQMLDDGWNVKELKAREEGDDPVPYIQVSVSYRNQPPTITMITTNARTLVNESTVEMLDWAEFDNVDLICNGYDWAVNGKTGTKAYLKKMYCTLAEDALDLKYAVDDAGE